MTISPFYVQYLTKEQACLSLAHQGLVLFDSVELCHYQ